MADTENALAVVGDENKLAAIVKESGLDFQRGKAIKEQFAEFELVVSDWSAKAELIKEQKRLEDAAEQARKDAKKAEEKANADKARAQVEAREAAERAAQVKIEEAAAEHAQILAKALQWRDVTCPHCGAEFKVEADNG